MKEQKIEVKSKRDELKKEMDSIHYDFYVDNYYSDLQGYIPEIIMDFADNEVDIYYSSLREWLKNAESAEYMDEAIEECFVDTKNYDFYKHIQAAQYLCYCDEFYDNEQLDIMLKCYVLDYLVYKDVCTISRNAWDVIEGISWDDFDTARTVDILIDEIKEYLVKGGVL